MTIYAKAVAQDFCCGVIELGRFYRNKGDNWDARKELKQLVDTWADTQPAFMIAEFINEARCKEAYDILKKHPKLKLVSQTEPATNYKHSAWPKNKVFVCVYEVRN